MLPRLTNAVVTGVWQAAGLGCSVFSKHQVRQYASELALRNSGLRAGPGGRSSISGAVATVFGANGFVGSYIVSELARRGTQVIIPYRTTENAVQHLKQMGDLGQIVFLGDFQIGDTDAVSHAISRSNIVINLIGQRLETMNYSFEDVHVKWPHTLASIVAQSPQVERFLHFSECAAVPSHPSRRLSTKAHGDALVRSITPSATIIKPGHVVGLEDSFFNLLVYRLSFGVIAPIVDDGTARMQPTWVQDVSDAVWEVLRRQDTKGQDYYLTGPETLTWRQVHDLLISTMRLQTDDTVHLPKSFYKAMGSVMDWVRRRAPMMPMDNYMASGDFAEESSHDSLAPKGALGYANLGINPSKVTEGLPLEPIRHYRQGGYSWGDMTRVARDVPEHIKKFYNLK